MSASAREYFDVWVCQDCYMTHHYGAHEHDGQWFAGESDTPANREPLARLTRSDLADNVDAETGDGLDEFSRSSCDGCGSTLGGSRYRLAMFETDDDEDDDDDDDAAELAAETAAREVLERRVGRETSQPWPRHAWPGGYAIAYITDDGAELCASCLDRESSVHFAGNADGWRVDGAGAYGVDMDYPDTDAICAHCAAVICEGLEES